MGAAGLVGLGGGAPVPDAERVAAIRFTILDEAEAAAGFGEAPRAVLVEKIASADRLLRSNPHAESRARLAHLKAVLDGLDIRRLQPRRGLAGLFDSRNKRLKAFRAAWTSAVPLATETAAEIAQRGRVIVSRREALEDLWAQTQDAIADIDAHILAARAWLADQDPTDPMPFGAPGPVADLVPEVGPPPPYGALEVDEQVLSIEPGPGEPDPPEALAAPAVTRPHPMHARLDDLVAIRAAAVASLPVLRAIQNAEHGLPERLARMPDAIEAWRLDWRDALGLAGKRPRKVRPDPNRLDQARQGLIDTIEAADLQLAASVTRSAELEGRMSGSK